MNDTNYVSVDELAQEFGLDKSNTRKYILGLGFTFSKMRSPIHRQLMNVVTMEDAEEIREARRNQGFVKCQQVVTTQDGYFYIIRLYPDLSTKRIKVGFATSLQNRLAAHRTAAPTAELLASWPCKNYWEKTAIDSIARVDCILVANEVYDCEDVQGLIGRGNQFFALMPRGAA